MVALARWLLVFSLAATGVLFGHYGFATFGRELALRPWWLGPAYVIAALEHLAVAVLLARRWRHALWLARLASSTGLAAVIALAALGATTPWLLVPTGLATLLAAARSPSLAPSTTLPASIGPGAANSVLAASAATLLGCLLMRAELRPARPALFWSVVATLVLAAIVAIAVRKPRLKRGLALLVGLACAALVVAAVMTGQTDTFGKLFLAACLLMGMVYASLVGAWRSHSDDLVAPAGARARSEEAEGGRRLWRGRAVRALVAFAGVLCLVGWARLGVTLGWQATPGRMLELGRESALHDPVLSAGPWTLFQDGQRVFALVWYQGREHVFAALYPREGRFGWRWSPWRTNMARTVAVARRDSGTVALVRRRGPEPLYGHGEVTPAPEGQSFHVYDWASGRPKTLGAIEDPGRLGGAAWRQDGFELVVHRQGGSIGWHRLESDRSHSTRDLDRSCNDSEAKTFEYAYPTEDGWTLVCSAVSKPRGEGLLKSVNVEIVELPVAGARRSTKLALKTSVMGGEPQRRPFVVKAEGNVIEPRPDPLATEIALWRKAGKWQRIVGSPQCAGICRPHFHYWFDGTELKPRPSCARWDGHEHLLGERWLAASTGQGYFDETAMLAGFDGAEPSVVARDFNLWGLTVPLPAERGGYWFIGTAGSYIETDASLDRLNPLSIGERLERASEIWSIRIGFARFLRAQMVGFGAMLTMFPLGLFVYLGWRLARRRDRPAALLDALGRWSSLCIVVWLLFAPWFFELMNEF